jgi:hypothetical protein
MHDNFWTSDRPRSLLRNFASSTSRPAVSGAGSVWNPNIGVARSAASPDSGRNKPLQSEKNEIDCSDSGATSGASAASDRIVNARWNGSPTSSSSHCSSTRFRPMPRVSGA